MLVFGDVQRPFMTWLQTWGVDLRGGGFVWEHYTVDFEIDWERSGFQIREKFLLRDSLKPMRT